MRFKVGDKVRIREDYPKIGWNLQGKMHKWIGKTMTIKSISSIGMIRMEEDHKENFGKGWLWTREDLKKVD